MTMSKKKYLARLIQYGHALKTGRSLQDIRNRVGQIWGLKIGKGNNNVQELFIVVRSDVDRNGSYNTYHLIESLKDGKKKTWKETISCDWDVSPHHRRIA